MTSIHINPQEAKRLLHNATDIGKETGASQVFPFVAFTIDNGQAMSYGRSAHCVGWSFLDHPIQATEQNTVMITHDEAKELGMAIGKTSAAKDATVWMEVTDDNRLVVNYGSEEVADMVGVEPEPGDIEAINTEQEIFRQASPAARAFFAMTIDVVKRFSKIRDKSPILDLFFTDVGNTVFAKIGSGFIGGFEAVDRHRVEAAADLKLFNF